MRFVDKEIQIKIYDPAKKDSRYFKAYLEKNDITVQTTKITFPNMTFYVGEPEAIGRPVYNLDLAFNVIAEDRDEAIENFEKMHFIYDLVKPAIEFNDADKWKKKESPSLVQFLESSVGEAGSGITVNYRFKIKLKALPRIGSRRSSEEYSVFPNNISCTPIYEMGYVQVPYWAGAENQQKLYVPNSMNMIPIGYKVSMNLKIVLGYTDSIIDVTPKEFKTAAGELPPPAAGGGLVADRKLETATRLVAAASIGGLSPEESKVLYEQTIKFGSSLAPPIEFSVLDDAKKSFFINRYQFLKSGILDDNDKVISGRLNDYNLILGEIRTGVRK